MEILLSAAPAGQNAALDSLRAWLTDDPMLTGKIGISYPSAERPDAMGTAVDVLVAAAGSGGAVTVLTQSIKSWIDHYMAQRGVMIHVEAQAPDGTKVTIDAKNADNAEQILRDALERGRGSEG
jgi:Effector Associated Constant Component 1